MSNSNITTGQVQEAGQKLYAGVDLALEKNVVMILNQAGQVVDRFEFMQDREGYEYFEQRGERVRQREQASGIEVAMEPSNYLWKLLAQEMEEKQKVYRLVNAYTVKKHREGNQLDRSKDDWRDAREIGELARQGQCTDRVAVCHVFQIGTRRFYARALGAGFQQYIQDHLGCTALSMGFHGNVFLHLLDRIVAHIFRFQFVLR